MDKLNYLFKRAQSKKMDFDLDKKWLSKKLRLKKCEVSGLPFNYHKGPWHTLSIDRIDSNHGYTKENCKAILLGINIGKGQNCTYDEVYTISKAFVEKYEKDNNL